MDVKITVVRKVEYQDLKEQYENPILHTCDLEEGMEFISHNGEKPVGLCDSAWNSMKSFVIELAHGGGNFYDGWMKNPKSAMISCNDGFRPVSFLIETIIEGEKIMEKENNVVEEISTEEVVDVVEIDNTIDEEELKARIEAERQEQEKMQKKHERFMGFKKAYNRAGLNILIFFGILQIVCSTFMYIGMGLSLILSNGIDYISLEDLLNVFFGAVENEYSYLNGIFYIIGYAITIVLTLVLCKKLVYGKETNVETNVRKLTFPQILLMLAICFGVWGVGTVVGNLPSFLGFDTDDGSMELIFGQTPWLYLIMAVFGAPFIEEVVCRKFFIDKTAKYGETVAVMISALFFGLMHANSGQFFLAFNLGLVMGVIYVKTRNILYTMLIHFVINFWGTFTDMVKAITDNEVVNEIAEKSWNIINIVLIVVGIVMTIIFVFVKKDELFTPKSNNEFAGNMAFKAIGVKLFFIITLVLTGFIDLMGFAVYLNRESGIRILIGILLQLLVEVIFVLSIIGIRKYITKTMYPKVTFDEE